MERSGKGSRWVVAAAAWGLAGTLAACSSLGAGENAPVESDRTPPARIEPALAVELDDFYFEPRELRLTAGDTHLLTLHNEGKAPHTFTSQALGIDVQIGPGETREVQLTPGQAGTFPLICRLHHETKQMTGNLIVGSEP